MSDLNADLFWAFSLRFYALPGVEADCLRLQDEGGLNVNLALWCCWRAGRGEKLDRDDIRAAQERIAEWSQTVTTPLRALRRRVKEKLGKDTSESIPRGLYQRLKKAELEAERVEQALLCRTRERSPQPGAADALPQLAEANLHAYLTLSGIRQGSDLRKSVTRRLARQITSLSENF